MLERVAGRRLVFAVRLLDGERPVASSLITRVVVNYTAFLRQAGAEAGPAGERAVAGGRAGPGCAIVAAL